ncbi:MAG: SpoIIE family protein phosphatase [Melioribacteraceae bacterium]|nr:SpoIIE family protein phosphatase [Melioribacteraceae bacterium]
MEYIHIEIEAITSPKINGQLCGDVYEVIRNKEGTTIIFADGIKSGVKANLAATMYVSHLKELLQQGQSLRESVLRTTDIIERSKTKDNLYTAFIIARILNNGNTTIISYEMPPPIIFSNNKASILKMGKNNSDLIMETHCNLSEKEAFLFVSDGISEAGMGSKNTNGWGVYGMSEFLNYKLSGKIKYKDIPKTIYSRALEINDNIKKDDMSIVLAKARKGTIVNVFSGPPSNPKLDYDKVSEFVESDGIKIICGATTAKIVASYLNKKLFVEENYDPLIPPAYEVEGIDLVTEGTVTLNQVYNLLDEDITRISKRNVVGDFVSLLSAADKINFFIGTTANPANDNIEFVQQGLLKRTRIIPLIADKLKKESKTVIIKYL